MSNSIVDYVFRALGLEYLNRTDIVQNPPEEAVPVTEESAPNPSADEKTFSPVHEEQPSEPINESKDVEPSNGGNPTTESVETKQDVQFLTKVKETEIIDTTDTASNSVTTVQEVLGDMMGDAPACPDCGHITIRNGSCYKCLNCGNSLGCS